MNDLQFNVSLDDVPGLRPDAVLGDTVFEVVVAARDVRRLSASWMKVGHLSSTPRKRHSILILDDPLISDERLQEEWAGIQSLFRPEILDRITLVILREDALNQILGTLSKQEQECIEKVAEHVRSRASQPVKSSSDAFFDILRVLLIHWFRRSGPLSAKELTAQTGFSYPTIAGALEKLEPHLLRHSDRRVELQAFPRDAWLKLLAQGEKVRSSKGYTDPSGRPRSPEVLLDRLRELGRDDVAVAGVVGARHFLPGLDLTGIPRLDLVVHARRAPGQTSFVRRLDPALKPAKRGEPCQVVVHTLFRPEPFFSKKQDSLNWADEVECLLDLHEARLESQALEFLEHLVSRAGGSAKILVVENDDQIAAIILKALQQLGHKPVLAQTGPSALRRFSDALSSSNPFDLVLLKTGSLASIEEAFGIHVIHELDSNARVIAATASLDKDELIRKGFSAVLLRPFLIADLERSISNALSHPRPAART